MDSKRDGTILTRMRAAVRAEDGMALATVVGISAVLFLLSTTLMMLATQEQVSAGNQVQRTKALHAADAGINDYIYHLSRDYNYWQTSSDVTSSTGGATWTVHASRDANGTGPIYLTAVGTIPAQYGSAAARRTVKASVQSPTFADYMFMFNTGINIGSGAIIKGHVRSNASIANAGTITGNAYAHTTYSGYGVCYGTIYQNYATQLFSTVDYAELKSIAATDGTDFSGLPTYETIQTTPTTVYRAYLGYEVRFSGAGGTITPIQAINTSTGVRTLKTSAAVNFTIPEHGVIYFDYPIWLSGTYGGKVTVASDCTLEETGGNRYYVGASGYNATGTVAGSLVNKANSAIYTPDSLVPDDPSSDHVCGVVVKGDISLPSNYDSMPNNLNLQAAFLSTAGSLHADMMSGKHKDHLQFTGADCQFDVGGVTNGYDGFLSRDYWYDQRLNMTPPPNFPPLGNGELKVQTWVEN